MNKPNTLTQTAPPTADELREHEERFEEWCELTGTDPSWVGAWETFERGLE